MDFVLTCLGGSLKEQLKDLPYFTELRTLLGLCLNRGEEGRIYGKHSKVNSVLCVCVFVYVCSVMSDSFVTPWTVACQSPLSMGFSPQEYWRGLPFPSPEDFPDPGIKPMSLALPALAGNFFTTEPPGTP